jgi:excisionase family DNA binding protein
MNTQAQPNFLTISEVASQVGVDYHQIYRAINSGAIHTVKVGKRRFVPAEALSKVLGGVETKRVFRAA